MDTNATYTTLTNAAAVNLIKRRSGPVFIVMAGTETVIQVVKSDLVWQMEQRFFGDTEWLVICDDVENSTTVQTAP